MIAVGDGLAFVNDDYKMQLGFCFIV